MSKPISHRVYDFYGRFYDGFEFLFKKRLARAIEALALRPGQRLLDIGIGTGLSLEFYSRGVHVVGIDLSQGMLDQARRKLREGRVRDGVPARLTELIRCDALQLPFAPETFDAVFISHVLTTVPEPWRAMHEALRVCRPHARLALVNHFRSPLPPVGWMEAALDPLCRHLGWRSDLALADLLGPLGARDVRHPKGLLFQTVFLEKRADELRCVQPQELEQTKLEPSLAP